MKHRIFKLSLACSIAVLLFSCKKTNISENLSMIPLTQNNIIRSWLESHPGFVNYQKYIVEGKVIHAQEIIAWEKSEYFPESKTSIIPVYIESINGHLPSFKYLVIQTGEEGKIISGNYYYVLTDKIGTDVIEKRMPTPELLNFKTIPGDFTGAIMKYDLKNTFILSKHYDSGELTNKADVVTVRKSKKQAPEENIAPLGEGCSYVLIDWYWQIWVNGILVYEEYIGSSNIIVCEGGGGGGGGGGNGGLTCEQQNENFVNMGIAFNGPVTAADVFNNGTTWIKSYNWPIYKAGTWALFSYERGTLEKVYYHAGQSRWEFQSFEHLHIAEVGINIGGTRTFTDLGATINITPTRMSAWVQIDFSVSSRVICWPVPPITLAHNSYKTFYAPNTIIYPPN